MAMTSIRIALLFATLFATASVCAQALVEAEPGELPIILTAPHGGVQAVPGCEERVSIGTRFVTRPDVRTDQLARAIADELKRLTGKSPYLIIARFHRKYIDANRPAAEAYAGVACAAEYAAYHAAIRRTIDEVRLKHPRAMLFDIHGQAAHRDAILRGTRDGRSVSALLARSGASAVTGPDSVFGRFAAMGYSIIPPNDTAPTDRVEARNYSGGYTVAIYGSDRDDGIDAMQLEFGRDLREHGVIERTAIDTARAIAAFHHRFLR